MTQRFGEVSAVKPENLRGIDDTVLLEWHGAVGVKHKWPLPGLAAISEDLARPDQSSNQHDASEYLDDAAVLNEKINILASLISKSNMTVVYSGAGMSRAAGIPDYATRAINSVMAGIGRLHNPMDARPTMAHECIVTLQKQGLIHAIINQNHDGLFEKCGIMPEMVNSIHGDWYDPGNPVVQFSGNLRRDKFQNLVGSFARLILP